MDESVMVDADVHESTKLGDIRDDAWKYHADLKIFHCSHSRIILKHLNFSPRVSARFLQFLVLHNVAD